MIGTGEKNCSFDQNWKTILKLNVNVKGRDVTDEEEMELLKGEKFASTQNAICDAAQQGDRKRLDFDRNPILMIKGCY